MASPATFLSAASKSVAFEEASSGWTLTPFTCVFFQKATEPRVLSQIEYPSTDIREHSSFPPSVSPTLIYTSIAVTHVTNNCVWVQSSFARFSCFTFIFSDLQVFFRAKNLKLVDVILALVLQMWHLCDLQRLQGFFFMILLQALMFNNSTIKWYSNVFCFDLCESPVWIYTVAFESEALWCDVNKR